MLKEHVIALRDKLKGQIPNANLEVWCDNSIFYNEPNDILDWDDKNGILRVLRTSENYAHDLQGEFQFCTTEYDFIQFINSDCGRASVARIAKDLEFSEENVERAKDLVHRATTISL